MCLVLAISRVLSPALGPAWWDPVVFCYHLLYAEDNWLQCLLAEYRLDQRVVNWRILSYLWPLSLTSSFTEVDFPRLLANHISGVSVNTVPEEIHYKREEPPWKWIAPSQDWTLNSLWWGKEKAYNKSQVAPTCYHHCSAFPQAHSHGTSGHGLTPLNPMRQNKSFYPWTVSLSYLVTAMEKLTQKINTGSRDMSMTNLITSFFKSLEPVCWKGLGKWAGWSTQQCERAFRRGFQMAMEVN